MSTITDTTEFFLFFFSFFFPVINVLDFIWDENQFALFKLQKKKKNTELNKIWM